MSRGYYLMARGWMDHPAIATNEPFTRREAWVWLIENAAFRDTRLDVHGVIVPVLRGQVCRSYRDLATTWGWSLGVVQRFIARLAADTLIVTQTDTKRLLVTLCNYEKYQAPWSVGDTDRDTEQNTTAIHRRYTGDTQKKEGKEGKEFPASQAATAAAVQEVPPVEQSARADTPPVADEAPAGEDLFGGPPPPAQKRPTAASLIFSEAVPKLVEMTGLKVDTVKGYLGTLRRDFPKQDAIIVRTVQDAHLMWLDPEAEKAEPKGWIRRAVEARVARRAGSGAASAPPPREVPAEVNGWIVQAVVDRCCEIAHVDFDGRFDGNAFSLVVVDALQAGQDTAAIYAAMKRAVARPDGVDGLGIGWFRTAFMPSLRAVA